MLELKQVFIRFAEKEILAGLSLALTPGKVTCLLGPSGCGKTTLLRVAAGLLTPDAGEVVIAPELRSSFVFQEDRLLPWFTALENLTALGIPAIKAEMYLQKVGLGAECGVFPEDMSGGMRRRLAIARALAYGGDLFFLDEPMQGLDKATAMPVLETIRETIRNKTTLLITHNPQEALDLGDTLLLADGPPIRIIRTASTDTFETTQALEGWLSCCP